MKKWILILLITVVIAILGTVYVYFFVYNKPHTDYEKAKADYTLTAKELFDSYKSNKVTTQQKYNGKVIELSGKLSKVEDKDSTTVVIFVFNQGDFGDEGIRCSMLSKFNINVKQLKPMSDIKVKGYCTGYNDTDVIFEKCSIL